MVISREEESGKRWGEWVKMRIDKDSSSDVQIILLFTLLHLANTLSLSLSLSLYLRMSIYLCCSNQP